MSIELLDFGYVKFIESWGSDERIIEAARMSTDKGFQGWTRTCKACELSPIAGTVFVKQAIDDGMGSETECEGCNGTGEVEGDSKLLRFLYSHKHMTPFEMAGMVIEVQAPIFVFREWHRHRTQSYNELSARYTPMPDLNYVPTVERLMLNSKTNKQAGTATDADELTVETATMWAADLKDFYVQADIEYRCALSTGVPKELARLVIPVGRYSRMRASANLRNWLQFLTLRQDAAAQWEIQQYANAVFTLVQDKFPRTAELFKEK